MLQRVGIAQALINDPELVIPRRADVRARPARPPRRPRPHPAAARSRLHRVLQLARAERRRGALQPRRDPRAGPPRGRGPAERHARASARAAGSWSSPTCDDAVVRALAGARPQRPCAIAAGRYALELPLEPPPERLLTELVAGGAHVVSLNPIRETLEDFFVAAGRRARRRCGRAGGRSAMSAIAAIAVNVFRESVRDKVLYNLVVLRDPADGRVVPDRPAHRRPGRQDHQGPRARGDVDVRPVHRRVHRHRPRVEGGRAAQHLQPARQADPPPSVRRSASTPAWC